MLAMILTLLPVSALAADTGSQPTSTTLRMKKGETRSIQFESGMSDLTGRPVSAANASVTVSSTFKVANAPVTDAKVPEGYYYIRGTREAENGYWSDGNLAAFGWGDKENLQWLTYTDMLLTDPPYGTTRNYWDVPLPLPELWEAVKWAVKPNGAVLFFAQCPFDKVLGASNLAMLRYEWIWYKERGTGFLNANRAPLKKSENILVFYQKSPVYNPQFTYGKPYARVHSRSGTSSNYGKFERQGSESNDGRRYPGNVLFVPTVSGGIHPTQKPVELCEYLIRTYTHPGELVADICAGSGTTAIAAINTERRFVCFETAPSFYAAASERIRAAQAVKSSGEKGV